MTLRNLGKSSLKVAPLALGGNVFGWTINEATSFQILDAYVDAGYNLIDTADVYSKWAPGNKGGESETILGKWFRQSGKRHKVVLATKVGFYMQATSALDQNNLKKSYILQAVEDSLKRLQIDCIDLYQTHIDDPTTPVAETMEALHTLVQQGKVRALGASQIPPARIRESQKFAKTNGLTPYTCLQPGYNLIMREEYEIEIEPVAEEFDLGVITYYSLAAGFLTGKYRSAADLGKSVRGERSVKNFMDARGLKIVGALDQVSQNLQAPMSTVALAWLLANPTVTAPIVSATNLQQLQDILRAPQLKLDHDSLQLLNDASEY